MGINFFEQFANCRALRKLKLEDEDALMAAIARKRISDEALMEALMPGSAGGDGDPGGFALQQ